jgi:Tol biopolymer transport system component/predicted Ser/Thr protein kinase
MSLAVGTKLGPYEIVAPIGAGGMGEVHRARDTKLDREVAIKILPDALAQDPDRLARFEREAKVLAALNHLHIAQIYGVEDRALVMELVEGENLHTPLPIKEALAVARQIAEALEAAHEKGIVHRDLKPSNIKVTPAGVVKVLDFGLAAMAQPGPAVDASISPTITINATQPGMILGTAAYMSPEQAAGKPVDKRSDIWSFGVVLWEMLTGHRLFHGDTITQVLADVLRGPIDFDKLPNETPLAIRNLLQRCLDRDAKTRLRDIGEARIALSSHLSPPENAPSRSTARLVWITATTLFIAAAALALFNLRRQAPELLVTRLSIYAPPKTRFFLGQQAALSPDGRRLAFDAVGADGKRQLWIRSLDSLTAQPLPETEGALYPFWSPDSRYVAFMSGSKLKKIDPSGGPATVLCDSVARGGTWNQDGVIVFAERGKPLQSIPSSGGVAHPVTAFDATRRESAHRWPWFLPDGKHFLYFAGPDGFGPVEGTIRAGSLDGGESKIVLENASSAAYAGGRVLFVRGSTLMAQPFDPNRLALTGEPVPVAENVQVGQLGDAFSSVSQNGFLIYRTGGADTNELIWFDRSGKRLATAGESGTFGVLNLSPDGKRAATSVRDLAHENSDIWLYDLARGVRTRFTSDPASGSDPIWSSDGSTVVFSSNRRGKLRDLYRKSASGLQAEELLYADDLDKVAKSWSPDGKYLLFVSVATPGNEIWLLPDPAGPVGDRKPTRLTNLAGNKMNSQFSPDGHWVAFNSSASGRAEIYVVPFLGAGGLKQVSLRGGVQPRWRRDGRELFYIAPDNNLMAVEVSLHSSSIDVGPPRLLFGSLITGGGFMYDVSPDGQRILAITETNQDSDEPITVVQNWPGLLKK